MNPTSFVRLVAEECAHIGRRRWFAAAFGALLLALLGSVWQGRQDLRAQTAQYDAARFAREQAQVRANLVALGRAVEPGLRVLRPPAPGVILVPGDDWRTPAAWEVLPAGVDALPAYASALRRFHLAEAWNLAGLVRIWAAALALLLGLALGLPDRAPGLWTAVASWPGARAWLCARLVAGVAIMVAAVGLSWTTVSIALWAFAGDASRPAVWPGALPATLYLTGWWAVGVGSAWRARTAVRATLSGVALWIAGAVFAPAIALFVSDRAAPVPPVEAYQQERQEAYADALRTSELEIARQVGQRVPNPLATGSELEAAIVAAFPHVEAQWRAGFTEARAVVMAQDAERRTLEARQEQWAAAMVLLLPGASLESVLAEMVGTGASMREAWQNAAAGYHLALQPALFDNRPTANLRVIMGDRAALHGIPRRPPPAIGSLPTVVPPDGPGLRPSSRALVLGTGLLAWAGLAMAFAWRAGQSALTRPTSHRSID